MSNEVKELRLKYRPKSFEEFVGNEKMVRSLKSILDREEGRPHTLLFQGPSGCGKTTLARIVARELGCSFEFDLKEYNISDMRGIDTARELIRVSKLSPLQGKVRVYILDECHKATNEFQNAMLDLLEAPPPHVYFLLCTTEPQRLLATIRGQRAMVFQLSSFSRPQMIKFLKDICNKEGVEFPSKHLVEIARSSNGSPRAALNILDQVIDIDDDEKAFDAILSASASSSSVKDILDLLMAPGQSSWKTMAKLIKNLDVEPEDSRYAIKGYMGSVFLNSGDRRHYDIMSLFLDPLHYSGREGLIEALYLACQV